MRKLYGMTGFGDGLGVSEYSEFHGVHAVAQSVPGDQLFGAQWHLSNTGQTGGTPGIDLNVTSVWDDYTGRGVAVGVFDDAVDYTNPDLDDNYDASRQVTIDGVVSDPAPSNWGSFESGGDTHGTAVAGLIAAENNGIGGVGVAYGAKITGVAVLQSATDADFIEAMLQQRDFDVVNHSWGFGTAFEADFSSGDPFWTLFAASLGDAADYGRNELGTVIVKSAGNDRESGRDVNDDNFANDRHVITVGAVDHNGSVSWYSTPGAALLVVAPSSGDSPQAGITTTDLSGTSGDSAGDFRSDFGGTSAAAPQVSGVAALMLEANPGLGWRDVQEILAYSARHVGSDMGAAPDNYEWSSWAFNGAHTWNGGGLHFSNDYGFGLVDAHAAVRLAETWALQSTSANEQVATVSQSFGAALPDNDPAGVSESFQVADNLQIDHVELGVDITHEWRGDLTVTLTSPDGTVSTLLDRPLNGADDGQDLVFTLSSNAFWGETSQGAWTLNVSDGVAGHVGTLNAITFHAYGDTSTGDDLYVYTDEFATFGGDGGRDVLSDSGGVDTLNAAAVTSDQVIDLRPGMVSTIAGRALTIDANTWIENAQGGDGADKITGNDLANALSGNRGNDVLDGGAGDDILNGGAGADTLIGGLGNDTYYVDNAADQAIEAPGEGSDTVYVNVDYGLAAGSEVEFLRANGGAHGLTLTGNEFDNTIVGWSGNDTLYGGDGNDTLSGLTGADYMEGGAGNDTYYVDNAGDQVVEAPSGGTDTVFVNVSWALGGDSEVEFLRANGGVGGLTLTGNAFANTIVGWSGNDTLNGGDGNDALSGGAGNDVLDGGTGSDRMEGGTGNDTYYVDHPGDQVVEGVGCGFDTVFSAIGYTLGDNVENLTLTGSANLNGTGNALGNVLTGNDGANVLDGRAGADVMSGGAGNDTYYVDNPGDQVIEASGNGIDTVYVNTSYALATGSEVEVLRANGGVGGLTLTGNEFGNTIVGWSGADSLYGGDGDDTLSGLTGADRMEGGAGNDVYYVDNAGDHVIEAVGGGMDTVWASVNYALEAGSEVEVLRANAGSTGLTLTGNEFANGIVGSTGADVLNGGDGNDSLSGLSGNDILNGGDGADVLTGGTGADRLSGGTGANTFVFASALDIGGGATGLGHDVILDWAPGDRIDLSAIDANLTAAGDQAFTFIDTGAFSGIAGQLHIVQDAANNVTFIEGDANANKIADFQLELSGVQTLHSADFVL